MSKPLFLRLVPPILAVLMTWSAASGVSQAPSDEPQSVTIFVTASDKSGRVMVDLTQGDFRVFENKVEQKIITFAPARSFPLAVGLLLDGSNSRRHAPFVEKEAAVEFIRQTVREADQAFAAVFSDNIDAYTDRTSNKELMTLGI